MAIKRVRIDYTVYRSDHEPGKPFWDFRTFGRARTAARRFGVGARIYRNFNQTNKRGQALGDWWSGKHYWIWNGRSFERQIDKNILAPWDNRVHTV